jgi:DNA-binding transcriptional LysR family regulator
MPSLKLLIGFEAAARLSNYSRAADELSVSQSAVSHQIAQLEQHVGQQLFRRKGRGVELTVTGRLLHESVAKSFEVIRGGLGRIETFLDTNLLTLVCPAAIAHGWLQARLDVLGQQHPTLNPIISIDETARYIDEMDVDIAITRQPLRQQGVYEVPFLEDALVVVCEPALGKKLEGFEIEKFASHVGLLCLESDLTGERSGPFIREQFSGFRKAAIYDDARLLLDAVLRGRGIALVSRLLADESLARGALVQLDAFAELPVGSIWIARLDGESRSPLVPSVFESLLQLAQGNAPLVPAPDK